jgi:hypothetical protein
MRRRTAVVALTALAASVAGGCSTAEDEASIESTTRKFFGAVAEKDGAGACALLTPDANESLEPAGARCSEEILKLPLEGGETGPPEIWGEQARIRVGAETVFLTRWASGGRITAAGCEPRHGKPYDCEVEG